MNRALNERLSALLEGMKQEELSPTEKKERDLVLAHYEVKRRKCNPYPTGSDKYGFYIAFKVVNKDSEPLFWTNSGFKNTAISRAEPISFKSKEEAERAIKAEALAYIEKWRKDQTHLIIGW